VGCCDWVYGLGLWGKGGRDAVGLVWDRAEMVFLSLSMV
jgi:hypothetical protein